MPAHVYILANRSGRAIDVGVTTNLVRRIAWHRSRIVAHTLTSRHRVERLGYGEEHAHIADALAREKPLTGWRRARALRRPGPPPSPTR